MMSTLSRGSSHTCPKVALEDVRPSAVHNPSIVTPSSLRSITHYLEYTLMAPLWSSVMTIEKKHNNMEEIV